MSRPAVRTLALAAAMAVAAPAAASPDPSESALDRAMTLADSMSARADGIRSDLASGSLARAVRRMAQMAGLPEPGPAAASVAPVPLPGPLAGPLADLLGAARASAGAMAAAAAQGDGSRLSARAIRLSREILARLDAMERQPERRAIRLAEEVRRSPMLGAAAAGGLGIAEALDRTLPALLRAAAELPSAGGGAACDVADERPLLCVSGTDANVNDVEAALVVDLGGDDLWTSSAGGANSARCPADPQDDPSCRTSVAIDLAGNDRYAPDLDRVVAADHLVTAGSGLGGVGVLVDAAGDDLYEARVPGLEQSLDVSYLFGSGTMGLGLLADLGGSDTYELTGAPADLSEPYTHGSALTGMGALLDTDGVNSYRTVMAGPQVAPSPDGLSALAANEFVQAQAVGLFGSGLLYDRTGRAELVAEIIATAGPQEETTIVNPIAQGVAVAGGAALITGGGPTVYRNTARRTAVHQGPGLTEARVPGDASATGQAVGAIGSAILDDAGGDDTYEDTATSTHILAVTGDPACGCAEARLDTDGTDSADSGAGVSTQGVAAGVLAPNAGTLLADHGGDDTYSARAEQRVEVRASGGTASAGALASALPSRLSLVTASGQALGSAAPVVLLDASGDDDYELSGTSIVTAEAEANDPLAQAAAGSIMAFGQASTLFTQAEGALLDLGGRDRYRAAAISRAETSPNPDQAWDAPREFGAQGSAGGVLADLDDALNDALSVSPEKGTAAGIRGEGPGWVDVSGTVPGYGIAPLQPEKGTVTLEMDPANPSSASGGWVPFRARLTGPDGPIAGREVTFTIELESSILGAVPTHVPHRFSAHGFTDQDGWASGWLDITNYVESWGTDRTQRIAARYHGDESTRPALATQPLAIE